MRRVLLFLAPRSQPSISHPARLDEAVTQADGRFVLPSVRVGGPYRVSAVLTGFGTEAREGVNVNLGVTTDLEFKLKVANIAEEVTVTATFDPVFSTSHTGAATAISQQDIANLPTISGRLTDIIRMSPQYGGQGTFAGQDNRANNITIDGSYFNGSFGLDTTTGQPGDRTGVAPISLESIEQVQVSVAPYDVRQGNFVGANVNTVTKSGTNQFTGSVYTRYRNQSYVGTEASGLAFNPGTFKTTDTGEWVGGPIVKNKLFFFQSFEKQEDNRPLTTFTSNPGGAPAVGNTTRVLASDLTALSNYLAANFKYDTGPFDGLQQVTAGKPWLIKGTYNISNANKVNFRYNRLTSSTDKNQSTSGSLGTARTFGTQFLTYQNSNYKMLENIDSGVGEWNSVFGTFTNDSIVGNSVFDEPRGSISLFPFVVIGAGDGSAYTAFGSEPFTPFNLLNYKTFQIQDTVTKFTKNHSWTFGTSIEKFHSDNSFYFGIQSSYLVQHALGLLRRRQQLPRQSESHDLAGEPADFPGEVPAPARPDDAAASAARRLVCRGLRAGPVAAARQSDVDGGFACGRPAIRQYRVRQPARRRPRVPRSGWLVGQVQLGRAAGVHAGPGRRASVSTGTRCRMARRKYAEGRASSRANRRTFGFRIRSATQACSTASRMSATPPHSDSTRTPIGISRRQLVAQQRATSSTSLTRASASRRRGGRALASIASSCGE